MKRKHCIKRISRAVHACRLPALALMSVLAMQAQAGTTPQEALAESPVKRVISLTPHITELIFAAGAGDRIVATVSSSDYPPAALAIPRIGDGLNVSVEKALSFRPDLVVAWQPSAAALTLAPMLAQLHIPLRYSAPRTLRDIPDEIRRMGMLFNTQQTAQAAARALDERLQVLGKRYATRKRVSVFIEIGSNPLYTVGNDALLNDALRICGAGNVYADAFSAAPQVSAESVLVANPAVIITPARDAGRLEADKERWASLRLPAALQGHVYTMDPDALFRPGPRLIDAVQELCQYIDKAR